MARQKKLPGVDPAAEKPIEEIEQLIEQYNKAGARRRSRNGGRRRERQVDCGVASPARRRFAAAQGRRPAARRAGVDLGAVR